MKKFAYLIFAFVLLFSVQGSVFAQDAGVDVAMLELVDSKLDVVMNSHPTVYLVFENTASVPMKIGYGWDDVEEPSVRLIDDDGNELGVVNNIYTLPSSIMPGERGYAEIEFWDLPEDAMPVDFEVTFTGVKDKYGPSERVYMDATVEIEDFDGPHSPLRGLVATISNQTDYSNFLEDGYIALLDQEGKLVFYSDIFSLYMVSITPGSSVKTLVKEFYNEGEEEALKDVDYEKSIVNVWFDIYD
jgi:hypothetical protein